VNTHNQEFEHEAEDRSSGGEDGAGQVELITSEKDHHSQQGGDALRFAQIAVPNSSVTGN
jgi:hypothetical protein